MFGGTRREEHGMRKTQEGKPNPFWMAQEVEGYVEGGRGQPWHLD